MAESEKVRVTLGGRQVWCRITGSGTPILILQGWGGPTDAYFLLQDTLAASGYAVALPDLPGLPGKTESVFMPLDSWGDWIDELAAVTIERPFVLVAHSLSARIALQYLAKHGSYCLRCILVDPWLVSSSFQSVSYRLVARIVRRLCPLMYPEMKWVLDGRAWASALNLFAAVKDRPTIPCLVLFGKRDVARVLFKGWKLIKCESGQYDWGHSPQVTAVSQLAVIIDEFVRRAPAAAADIEPSQPKASSNRAVT